MLQDRTRYEALISGSDEEFIALTIGVVDCLLPARFSSGADAGLDA